MRISTRQGANQLLLALTLLLGFSLSARADTLTPHPDINDPDQLLFNFNSLTPGNTNGIIETYMNTRMGNPAGTPGLPRVVVTGATASKRYDGEGHVVGPCGPSASTTCNGTPTATGYLVTPITLGSSDFYTGGLVSGGDPLHTDLDGFLYTWNGSDRITFTFYDIPFDITHVGFDWQIFPAVGNNPDFSFRACNGAGPCATNGSDDVFPMLLGLIPGALGASPYQESRCTDKRQSANGNGDGAFEGEANASPCNNSSQTNQYETYKQLIGSTGLIDVSAFLGSGDIYRFEFIDWPNTIGIDNFYMPPPPEVPEPASMLLLGTGLLGIGRQWRNRQNQKKAEKQNVV